MKRCEVRAHEHQLYKVPEGISDENVVLTEPLATRPPLAAKPILIWKPFKRAGTYAVAAWGYRFRNPSRTRSKHFLPASRKSKDMLGRHQL